MFNSNLKKIAALIMLIFSGPSFAVTVSEDFTGTTTVNNWTTIGYACLTAGSTSGTIPACSPTISGSGALRLTPASTQQKGAIVSTTPFPTSQGLQAVFTTYTYGGNGADGIGFFLMDALQTPNIGSTGGSFSYSCSNYTGNTVNGITGGYLGLGMDEYGNFLNRGDNTATGWTSTGAAQTTSTTNTAVPQRIGLRGSGSVNWTTLNALYPSLYPSSLSAASQKTAVAATCSTGLVQNGTNGTQAAYSVSSLSWSNNVLTVNTSSTTPLVVGSTISIGTTSSSNPPKSNGNSIVGSYVVTGVTTSGSSSNMQFTVALPSTASTTYNNTFTHATNANISITVMDYQAVPGAFLTLPSTTPINSRQTQTSPVALYTTSSTSYPLRANAIPITYKLVISTANKLSLQYSYNGGSYQPVITNQSITAAGSGFGALPANVLFGFTGSTGGSTDIHEITCFTAQPEQSSSSAAANTVQSGQVQVGTTQLYLAGYNPNNWWGTLGSYSLMQNSSGVLSVAANANWDGGCVLTGGVCGATGSSASVSAQNSAARTLLTWGTSGGVPFEWTSGITSAQQTFLNTISATSPTTDSYGQQRLNWLRGDRTQEASATAPILRARTSVLGDIVDSSPTWVGAPSGNYASPFTDTIYSSSSAPENASTAQTYSNYASSSTGGYATRTNVVYAGGNDGLLHGFRAGSYGSTGSYINTYNDGLEVIGFMPSSVLSNANLTTNIVNLTSQAYGHSYFVNATPGTGDLFYNNAWHTWLVGGLGAGGAEIYALDITDPSQFSESNASTLVKGDWTASTLANLGNTYGTPIIRRLHNGQWAVIFGNGFGSSTYQAGVYVGLVDSTTGAITLNWLGTGAGSSSSPDGIAYVSSADLDGDHVTDYLYAGDLLGNVWRFDLTSSNTADWGVTDYGSAATATPLFNSGTGKPITTGIAVASANTGGAQRVMVMFGTGQKTPATSTAPDSYASGTQSVYGIWDYNMQKWNSGVTTTNSVVIPASTVNYAALSAPQSISSSTLLSQSVASTATASSGSAVLGYRSVNSANNVCWKGSSSCGTGNNQYGWYFDLPATNEQIIYNPIVVGGALVVNTTIPPSTTGNQCSLQTPTGWTMAFSVASGGGLPLGFFPNSSSTYNATGTGASASTVMGIKINGVGSPSVVMNGSSTNIFTQTVNGNAQITPVNPQGGINVKRITWEELR